ncbi:hypothetical protein AMS68_000935 [Peltaster fructicola]|uniref:Uncharacterized protein n=1 Tax=Peltaster fructicola TaxID=286661 RepID=A0A6H0XLA7_9PEZI|nr:hypothetical protein AMS68_000935 [Peltaster fructicola]
MSTGFPAHGLSMAERRFLRASWLQSGRCARCFHSARQQRAADQKKDDEVSPRRQRAAAITEELSALARPKPKRERAPRHNITQTSKQPEELAKGLTYSQTTQNMIAKSPSQSTKPDDGQRPMQRTSSNVEPSIDAQALIRQGLGSATIAGNGLHGVLADRLKLIERGQYSATGRTRLNNVFTIPRSSSKTRRLEVEEIKSDASKRKDTPIKHAQQLVISKLVAGQHDGNDLFHGKDRYKQSTLNEVARAMTLNPSYLSQDTARFVNKVRALLPAIARPRPNSASALNK